MAECSHTFNCPYAKCIWPACRHQPAACNYTLCASEEWAVRMAIPIRVATQEAAPALPQPKNEEEKGDPRNPRTGERS